TMPPVPITMRLRLTQRHAILAHCNGGRDEDGHGTRGPPRPAPGIGGDAAVAAALGGGAGEGGRAFPVGLDRGSDRAGAARIGIPGTAGRRRPDGGGVVRPKAPNGLPTGPEPAARLSVEAAAARLGI